MGEEIATVVKLLVGITTSLKTQCLGLSTSFAPKSNFLLIHTSEGSRLFRVEDLQLLWENRTKFLVFGFDLAQSPLR